MIGLRSWHPRADCSTLVPMFSGPATSFQHTALVTDQGIALLWGRDQGAQARELIHAADLRAREELRAHATGRRIT